MPAKMFETHRDHVHGVVLLAHGLNTKPQVMDALARVLLEEGFHCQRISLYEDEPGLKAPAAIVAESWLRTFAAAYDDACARHPDLPIYNLSFSIGALITIRFLQLEHSKPFRRMVLIAPPVALTFMAKLVRVLAPAGRLGAVLPSAAPKHVRARRGTPLAEYAAMLQLIDAVKTLGRARLDTIPTAVFLDDRDELVSADGVAEWMKRNGLASWSIKKVRDRAPEGRTYWHLLVTEKALGPTAWRDLTETVVRHLKGELEST